MDFNICFSANNDYIKYVAVLINSIISNLDKKTDILDNYKKIENFKLDKFPIHFHILTDNIEKENEDKLKNYLNTFEYPCKLYIHNFSDEYFIERGISPWTRDKKYICNYRLFLSDIFNDEKILYLDADMLVLGDLRILWELDLSDKIAAAVQDQCMPNLSYCRECLENEYENLEKLKLTKTMYDFLKKIRVRVNRHTKEKEFIFNSGYYFNSGFLFLNMQKFKEKKCKEKCFEFLKDYKTWLPDQDALNYAMPEDEVLWLPKEYNFERSFILDSDKKLFSYMNKNPFGVHDIEDYKKAVKNIQIVHFIGKRKPWHKEKGGKAQKLWIETARQTPWWDEIQKGIEEEKMKRKNEKIAKDTTKTPTASLDGFM